MKCENKSETEYAYATRRVRELLDNGWQRRSIVIRVSTEIRRQRVQKPRRSAEEARS